MIYSFYDAQHPMRTGLGNYIILDHIRRAAAEGLPYVYLGYWVEGSPRMQYKVRYRPLEKLTRDGWVRFSREEQEMLIADATKRRNPVPVSSGKDGRQPRISTG